MKSEKRLERTGTRDAFRVGVGCMLAAGLCYSIMVAIAKQLSGSLPVPQIVTARLGVNLLFVVMIMQQQKISFLGTERLLLAVRGLSGTISIGLAFYAASAIPLVDMTILVKMSVIFTALIAALWLREEVTLFVGAHIILAFFGISLIVKPSWMIANWGGAAALGAAFLIGLTGVLIRRLHEEEDPYTIIFYFVGLGTVSYTLLFGSSFVMPNLFQLLLLLAAGVAGTIGQQFFTIAYRFGPAAEITPFLYSEVLFAAIFGVFFFDELPDILSLFGIVLAVYAGIAIARARAKRGTPHPVPVAEAEKQSL